MSNNYNTSYNDSDHYVMPFESFNSGVIKSKVCIIINRGFFFCFTGNYLLATNS